jgi:hypothetical protein
MREPFTRHARLLAAARQWKQAEQLHKHALDRRREDIRALRNEGHSALQVGRAFGLSAGRVREIANEGGRR